MNHNFLTFQTLFLHFDQIFSLFEIYYLPTYKRLWISSRAFSMIFNVRTEMNLCCKCKKLKRKQEVWRFWYHISSKFHVFLLIYNLEWCLELHLLIFIWHCSHILFTHRITLLFYSMAFLHPFWQSFVNSFDVLHLNIRIETNQSVGLVWCVKDLF